MSHETIKFKSGGVDITAELFSPPVEGRQPVIIIAYGTGGMMPPFGTMYTSFAEGLAKAGFFVVLPDYIARTKTRHDLQEMLEQLPMNRASWVSALYDTVIYTKTLSQVDASRVALCGFSLGGNLMIHVAQKYKAIAFVDFFAPTIRDIDPDGIVKEAMARNLPPTLIHHGKNDEIVRIANSEQLDQWLRNAKILSKLITYEGQGHPSVEDSSNWSVKSQNDSLAETIRFLDTHL